MKEDTMEDNAQWVETTVTEFLGLTPQEEAYIELKLKLSQKLKELRKERALTQNALAELIASSQPRVAKMEAGDPSVSIDLLVRSLFALELTNEELSEVIAGQ